MMEDLHDALVSHLGIEVAAFVHAVFLLDDPDRLAALCGAGGWGDATVTTHTLTLQLDPPADFLWQYLLGTTPRPCRASTRVVGETSKPTSSNAGDPTRRLTAPR